MMTIFIEPINYSFYTDADDYADDIDDYADDAYVADDADDYANDYA